MQGDATVLELLNEVLSGELTAINQYFIHAEMCENWGYRVLSEHIRQESLEEMKHAEELIERVLYLEGVPNMQRYFPIRVGETVKEQLELDLALEREALGRLNVGIASCVDRGDNGSRELLERILTSEEEHVDWLETQLEAMRQVGEERYLAQQLH
jgi:bacterioferritin